MDHRRRITYMFHCNMLRSFEVSVNRELDMGSDHRYVSVSIEYMRSTKALKQLETSIQRMQIYLR